jgi:hypothetical protein
MSFSISDVSLFVVIRKFLDSIFNILQIFIRSWEIPVTSRGGP